MNEAVRRHRQADEPNAMMIDQFLEVRSRLNAELQQLLLQVTETSWQIAA